MKIENSQYNALFGVTGVSDIFFTRFLPILDPDSVKIYLYVLYLSKNGTEISPEDLSCALSMKQEYVSSKLIELQQIGLLNLYTDRIIMTDLGLAELNKSYRLKTTGDIEVTQTGAPRLDEKYRKVSKTISDAFYEGRMPTDLFTDIILWVEKYGFEPETIYLLFQHCKDSLKRMPNRSYVTAVADSWGNKGIKTGEQASKYLENYSEFKKYKKAIEKTLKIFNGMTIFQEELVQKWYFTFKYSLDIVNVALSKSTNVSSASLSYYDKIISDWYQHGLKTVAEIENYENEYKQKVQAVPVTKPLPQSGTKQPQKKNGSFDERQYDDEFFKSFLGNGGKKND